jgi:hypothetical protein
LVQVADPHESFSFTAPIVSDLHSA